MNSTASQAAATVEAPAVGDSCVWATAAQECVAPRSCLDCLNVPVNDGQCAIDSQGVCVSVYDLSTSELAAGSYWASGEHEYCASSDADCAACRSGWSQQFHVKGQLSSDPVCATASGCVCLWACSDPRRHESVVSSYCALLGSGQLAMVSGMAFGMFLAFVALALILRGWLRKYVARQEEARASRRRRPRRQPSGPQLQLSAWNSMLDRLIESEKAAEDAAPPRLARQPSALAVAAALSPSSERHQEQVPPV